MLSVLVPGVCLAQLSGGTITGVDYGEWSSPDLYDHLSATETFGFDGSVDGTVTGSEIRGTMNGDLVYWNAPTYGPAWYCRATNHVVILRR